VKHIHTPGSLFQDFCIIALSIFIALILTETTVLERILDSTRELGIVGSFIAGLFFTSVFTTAPAIVTLGKITLLQPILQTAFFGAVGAVVGDLIIFKFVKDHVSEHVMELVNQQGGGRRLRHLLKLKLFRWSAFFVGGLIIASPLPDELGIALTGFSKMRSYQFVLLSFTFNFLGIILIGLVAHTM